MISNAVISISYTFFGKILFKSCAFTRSKLLKSILLFGVLNGYFIIMSDPYTPPSKTEAEGGDQNLSTSE